MNTPTRFTLSESDLPKRWYNIAADSPVPATPVLHPGTLEPVTPDFLSVIFPMPLIEQEISQERYMDIPDEVREIYKLWRPTPLVTSRSTGESTRYSCPYLLQNGRRLSFGIA